MDSKVAVYRGPCCPPDAALACDDDTCGFQSVVPFPAVAGEEYLIQLGNYPGSSSGTGSFFLTCDGYIPSGDLDSLGTDFLLVAQRNFTSGKVILHFTAEAASTVTVEYPLGTFNSTTNVAAGSGASVDLGAAPATDWTPDLIAAHVIHVTSTTPIALYMTNALPATADGALALPADALGLEYIVADYDALSGEFCRFTVFAKEDNTSVTITPTINIIGHSASVPFTIVLNRGDGYQAQSTSGGVNHSLIGTTVEADRPIGMTNGTDCSDVPNSTSACDTLMEIAQPVSAWGQSVIVTNLPQRAGGSLYRIIGSTDGTTWRLDGGTQFPLLNRGTFAETILLTGNHVITADAPIFVVQFMTGVGVTGSVSGDPSMCNMIPWIEYRHKQTFFVPNSGGMTKLYATIIAENADTPSLTLDNGTLTFTTILASGFSVAQPVILTPGAHTTVSNGLHGVVIEGYGVFESYVFPGGARFMETHGPCPPSGDSVGISIAGSPPAVSPKSATVSPGDIVVWQLPNAVGHACDNGSLIGTTLVVSFIGANPTVGAWVTTSPIDISGGLDTTLWVQLQNPLGGGSYSYTIKILDQYGSVLCDIDPGLIVPYPHSPPVRTRDVPPAHWR
jgi:hypothetical protein